MRLVPNVTYFHHDFHTHTSPFSDGIWISRGIGTYSCNAFFPLVTGPRAHGPRLSSRVRHVGMRITRRHVAVVRSRLASRVGRHRGACPCQPAAPAALRRASRLAPRACRCSRRPPPVRGRSKLHDRGHHRVLHGSLVQLTLRADTTATQDGTRHMMRRRRCIRSRGEHRDRCR